MNGNERPKPKDSGPSSRAPPIKCKHRGCTGDAQSRTHARTPNGHRACALDAHAPLPRKEMAQESERAGGVRGPGWRRAPVETPAVECCRQCVLQVAAIGKLFGCHIPGDTPAILYVASWVLHVAGRRLLIDVFRVSRACLETRLWLTDCGSCAANVANPVRNRMARRVANVHGYCSRAVPLVVAVATY